MLTPVPSPDFEYRMKRWWSWALYAFSVYATGHLIFVNYQFAKVTNDQTGAAAAAIASQLVLGVPVGFLMVMPFVTAAFACVALICIYRLSGRRFETTTIWSAWCTVAVVAVVMGGSIFAVESAARNRVQTVAEKRHQLRLEYINKIRNQMPPGTGGEDALRVFENFGRDTMSMNATQVDYDTETGLPATKWHIDIFEAGTFDIYIDKLTHKVTRTEIVSILD